MGVFHVFKIIQMVQNRATYHIYDYLSISYYIRGVKKVRNYSFEATCAFSSPLQIDTHTLKSHVGAMGELQFYWSGNIACEI